MKLVIDEDAGTLTLSGGGADRILDLYSKEAFEIVSQQWSRLGWNQK